MRMRHPKIDDEITVPDDPNTIAVHRDAGWEEVDEPVQHHPALAPGELPPDDQADDKPATPTSKTKSKE